MRISPGAPIEVFRTPHTALPATIAHLAAECAPRRPELDAPSAGVPLGAHYAERWVRTLAALDGAHFGAREGADLSAHPAPHAPTLRPSSAAGGIDFAGLHEATMKARRAVSRQQLPDEAIAERFAAMADDLEGDVLRAAADEPGPASPRARMLAMLDEAGPPGMSGPDVARKLAEGGSMIPDATLYRWLKADAADGGYGSWLHPRYRNGS